MEKHTTFHKTIPVGAYSSGNRIISPPFGHPQTQLRILSHEGAHVASNNQHFVEGGIIKPSEARFIDHQICDVQKARLQELFSTKITELKDGWQSELTEVIWRLMQIATKNKFDPGIIDLNVMISNEAFLEHASTINFSRSGIVETPDGFLVSPTKEGYTREIPAYYLEKIIETMMQRVIAPVVLPSRKRPGIASHYISYDGAQRWFRDNYFPTSKRINRFWNKYFD